MTLSSASAPVDTSAGDGLIMQRLSYFCTWFHRRMSPEAFEAFKPLFATFDGPARVTRNKAIEALEDLSYELRAYRYKDDIFAQNCLIGALSICPPRSGELTQATAAMEAFVAKSGMERLRGPTAAKYLQALMDRAAVIKSRLRYLAGHIRRRYTMGRARSTWTIGRHEGIEEKPLRNVRTKVMLEAEMAQLEQESPLEAAEQFIASVMPLNKLERSGLVAARRRLAFFGRVEIVAAINARVTGEAGPGVDEIFDLAQAHDRVGNHAQVLEQWRIACAAPYPMALQGSRPTSAAVLPYAPTLRSRAPDVSKGDATTWLTRRPAMTLGPAASLASMATRALCALGRDVDAENLAREPPAWLVGVASPMITIQLRMSLATTYATRDELESAVRMHAQTYDAAEAMLADMAENSPERAELLNLLSISTRSLIYHIDQGDVGKVSAEMASGLDGAVKPFLVVIDTLIAITERLLASPDVKYRLAELSLLVVRGSCAEQS